MSECAKVMAPKKAKSRGNKIASSLSQKYKNTIELVEISHIKNEDFTYLMNVRVETSPYKNDCCSKIDGMLCQKIK